MELDSIEVEVSAELVAEIRRLIIGYQALFRERPRGIAISPLDWLKLGVTLLRVQHIGGDGYDSSNEIKVDGVDIYCKLNGPPEVLARAEDAKYSAWMKLQDDKRLWPILTGA